MTQHLKHVLTVLLAVTTIAAQTICACPVPASVVQPAPQTEKACKGSGKCCVKDEPTVPAPVKPKERNRCDDCNVIHPAERVVPERQVTVAAAAEPFFAFAPVHTFYAGLPSVQLVPRCGVEHVPIPPLLQDLFHSGTLLLI